MLELLTSPRPSKRAIVGSTARNSPLNATIRRQAVVLRIAMAVALFLHATLVLSGWARDTSHAYILLIFVPQIAGLTFLWRAQLVDDRNAFSWRLYSLSIVLLGTGTLLAAWHNPDAAAFIQQARVSGFLRTIAGFPMLLSVAYTRRTARLRGLFLLDISQLFLAVLLAWVLLFRMGDNAPQQQSHLMLLFAGELILLAILVTLRLTAWSGREDLQRTLLFCFCVWLYLPIHLFVQHAATAWNIPAGTILDLLWNLPFLAGGFAALHLPFGETSSDPHAGFSRVRQLVDTLCPWLLTFGIFALAAVVYPAHSFTAILSMLFLLAAQTSYAGLVQNDYETSQAMLVKREVELKEANATLERRTLEDSLTGIANRRAFDAAFDTLWLSASRRDEPLSLMMIDVDFFKSINDRLGHSRGDECLVQVAKILQEQIVRAEDLLARYGGEEFALLLPCTPLEGALGVAQRMRRAIEATAVPNQDSPFGVLTISIGLATCHPSPDRENSELLKAADLLLYQAKHSGRNQVCWRSL